MIEMARRHVLESEVHVVRQRELVEHLRKRHLPTDVAEQLLAEFEQSLEDHRAGLESILKDQRAGLRDEMGEFLPNELPSGAPSSRDA